MPPANLSSLRQFGQIRQFWRKRRGRCLLEGGRNFFVAPRAKLPAIFPLCHWVQNVYIIDFLYTQPEREKERARES